MNDRVYSDVLKATVGEKQLYDKLCRVGYQTARLGGSVRAVDGLGRPHMVVLAAIAEELRKP